jgi:hypothetical protein
MVVSPEVIICISSVTVGSGSCPKIYGELYNIKLSTKIKVN